MKGLEKSDVTAKLFQVAETLPQEVLSKMYAAPKDESVPIITSDLLAEADGKFRNLNSGWLYDWLLSYFLFKAFYLAYQHDLEVYQLK